VVTTTSTREPRGEPARASNASPPLTAISTGRRPFARRGPRALFARGNWRCVYYGTSGGRLTLDHVVPRSRGGDSVWENVVTSCAPCNLRKGNRLLEETEFRMKVSPRPPSPQLFIRLAAPKIPQTWTPYLGDGALGGAAA